MPRKKINEQKTNESLKKAKILITIVDRNKVEFYLDVLSQFEINLQFVTYGRGTASNEALELLGLNNYKGIIFSIFMLLDIGSIRLRTVWLVLNRLPNRRFGRFGLVNVLKPGRPAVLNMRNNNT